MSRVRVAYRLPEDVVDATRRAAERSGRPVTREVELALRAQLGMPGANKLDDHELRLARLEGMLIGGRV